LTIFVSLASYCDNLLDQTMTSAMTKAKYPKELRFGVVEQQYLEKRLRPEITKFPQVRYIGIDVREARGACWARALAMTLYNDEDYFLQVDAHTVFEQDWDETLIKWMGHCGKKSLKPLLSSYPPSFEMKDGQAVLQQASRCLATSWVVNEAWPNEADGNDIVLHFRAHVLTDATEPVPGFHIAGGLVFTLGKFVYEVPYDPHLYFQGEEQNISARAYTHGYDIYHIPEAPIYHLYAAEKEGKPDVERNQRETHWVEDKDKLRKERWWELDKRARKRLVDLLHKGLDLGIYGIGKERTMEDFANFSGIDYANKVIRPQARKKDD
jgi:hypothetical protein